MQHILDMASAGDSLPDVSMNISSESVRQQLADMITAGVWAGEEMVIATAVYLRRQVHVYTYKTDASFCPRVYGPPGQCADGLSSVRVAFFLPGHYQAVESLSRRSAAKYPLVKSSN